MSDQSNIRQPWIYSGIVDGIFILSPSFISLAIVFLFRDSFSVDNEVPVAAWIFLVLFIDVAHVYSTLYRTYFDKETFSEHKNFLIFLPLFCWLGGILMYAIDGMLFWRCLAYLAVYHFIRQQYGFLKIYTRNDKQISWIDIATIYISTIYPILYWHLHTPRNFNWFIEGDFLYFQSGLTEIVATVIYAVILLMYCFKETYFSIKSKTFNLPKNLVVLGTALSWYFGIVYFNADLIFTVLNIVAHGVPYMALIWIYGRKKYVDHSTISEGNNVRVAFLFRFNGIILFLGILFLFAYIEEGLWDSLVWNDHKNVFSFLYIFQPVESSIVLSVIIPLLAVPQITHYVIDGFIWRIKKDSFKWKKVVLGA